MKYFAVFLKVNDTIAAEKYKEAHLSYVKQLCREEKIYLVGKLVDAGGLIIFQAESASDVEQWLANDPYIIHGARTYELHEWKMQTSSEYIY